MLRLLLVLLLAVVAAASTTDDAPLPPLQHSQELLLKELHVLYPQSGTNYKSPLAFRFQLVTPDMGEMMEAYTAHYWLCLRLDESWRRCIPIESGTLIIEPMAPGNHTAQLFMVDSPTPETGKTLMQSETVSFAILSDQDFATAMEQQRLFDRALYREEATEEENVGVVEWFRSRQSHKEGRPSAYEVDAATGEAKQVDEVKTETAPGSPTEPPLLVVGVKTRVVDGFPFRQAIRQTWANEETLPHNVRVLFAGCRVPVDASEEVRQAIAYEQKVYGGDLLTDVLDCEDSYATLPLKVKEFLHFVGTDHELRRAGFVMIADEDVYLKADELAAELAASGPLHDVYVGHVKEGNAFAPERDPQRRYYLPESVYPMDEFPPFAWGPHYIMSMDVVEFIADNREELQGLGPLDDVTIALWLLAIQVHPQHINAFQNLREAPCTNRLLAYADLGPPAMRIIQSNLKARRSFCHGFNRYTWDKDAPM